MCKENKKREMKEFLDNWKDCPAKAAFNDLKGLLEELEDIEMDFKARPGISYSLRGRHTKQKDRSLFVMIDVIDDDPENRWLSICFYQDMISDPQEKGDLIPGGLSGDDGYCFDLEDFEEKEILYIKDRIKEAYNRAAT